MDEAARTSGKAQHQNGMSQVPTRPTVCARAKLIKVHDTGPVKKLETLIYLGVVGGIYKGKKGQSSKLISHLLVPPTWILPLLYTSSGPQRVCLLVFDVSCICTLGAE